MTTSLPGPLAGTRVVTFAAIYQGPYATTLLADLGADVITVERPGTGDTARAQGGMFEALNRGKRSIVLDLKNPADQETARRLAGTADVLVEAFRPGAMERFGLGYPRLSAANPGLVHVSLSGFGQDGPYRDRAGHDLMYQAAAGLLGGLPDRPGAVHPPPELEAGAIVGALYAALGALAGLLGRAVTGRGTHVDLSTHEALLSVMSLRLDPVLNGPGGDAAAAPGREPGYGLYRCADGRLIALGIGFEDHFWALLCRATGLTAFAGLGQAERLARGDFLAGLLSDALATRPYAEWQEEFDRIGVPAGPVHRLSEVPADPHVRAREVIRTLRGHSPRRYVRQPLRLSAYAEHDPGPAPRLGEHTASLLRELDDTAPCPEEAVEP
ncbi:CaiB/BaiF CoA transferase family protein [Microbispora amethystogenes]|uniref:CoA transferase n=1 Tax=Microbispora amethystogenes TaxID=1427754 RepID=A0ABQ4FDF3_9ACTN|nr:CaiB/BaiF CoA-transferase family protein [Microbispora amethystogenes]GIH32830.1 CoA transferase [Microbispora amethystogenes]